MTLGPRIVLIHALEESVAPAQRAFREHWPEAQIFDLLDTALAADLAAAGALENRMIERFVTLGAYAATSSGVAGTTAGLLFTCSAFGVAIDALKQRLPIPVLRPNEAAFRTALAHGERVGLVVSYGPSASALSDELETMARLAGRPLSVEVAVAEGALSALKAGDGARHDADVAEAAVRLRDCDVVVLGQFSLARALSAAHHALGGVPVITTPASAVMALREMVAHGPGRSSNV